MGSDERIEVVKSSIRDVVPGDIHGFKVDITYGPLKDQNTGLVLPGRHGVFATLTPTTEALRRKLGQAGHAAIIGQVEVAPEFVEEMVNDEKAREWVASLALTRAAVLAKRVASAA